MTVFSKSVLDYWHRALATDHASVRSSLSCAVSAKLSHKRPAMLLERADGTVQAVIRPEISKQAGVDDSNCLSANDLTVRLENVGIILHEPDYLFYLPDEEQGTLDNAMGVRQLTNADRGVFDVFYDSASEQDREDAWVELDHWGVFGCFDGDRLVSAASMNLWNDSPIADLGVLTLPDARGKGFARAVVGAINRFSRQQGYEPQYRCQIDNQASVALARSCGLMMFGKWIVATEASRTGVE